ncbi:cyclin-dependent kinase inhibitor 1-like [Thamnophis elegans]|uniref:cyclin-dependent kinase inhibitor 1-like n=1 Tax=Thamnophis elegans TaxID=35005 RepID=UPI0013790210|nr:cyclin-dependent kinase inhibitor 1-like [Thamnophis elegans]
MDLISAKTAPTRRNLFGPVDHDHLLQEFQSMMRSSMEQAKQRWNFDFSQDVPIMGLLQWEELQGHEVPAFYHTHVARESRPPLQPANRTVDREGKVRLLGREAERGRAIKTVTLGKKRRQTYLTDYYTTKKQIRTDMQTPVKKLAF